MDEPGRWLKYTNKPNYKNRGDYGVRVARPGFDAQTCAQNQLLFNSGWPILQIAKVVKMDNLEQIYWIEHKQTIVHIDKQTYEWTIVSESAELVDDFPPGAVTNKYPVSLGEFEELSVNDKYIMERHSSDDGEFYHTDSEVEESDYYVLTMEDYSKFTGYRKKHNLGYTPFFLKSDNIFCAGAEGYVLLFTVDITRDIDYPYTEEALPLLSTGKDYGIKSESIFGENVPGLCSNMFSKLVQAVKTYDTVVEGTRDCYWSPLTQWTGTPNNVLLPFEPYAFRSPGFKMEGGMYYGRSYVVFEADSNSQGSYSDSYVVAAGPSMTPTEFPGRNSLVVLRSPMVSPEYEEI